MITGWIVSSIIIKCFIFTYISEKKRGNKRKYKNIKGKGKKRKGGKKKCKKV